MEEIGEAEIREGLLCHIRGFDLILNTTNGKSRKHFKEIYDHDEMCVHMT